MVEESWRYLALLLEKIGNLFLIKKIGDCKGDVRVDSDPIQRP